jgi:hypothetical protein
MAIEVDKIEPAPIFGRPAHNLLVPAQREPGFFEQDRNAGP